MLLDFFTDLDKRSWARTQNYRPILFLLIFTQKTLPHLRRGGGGRGIFTQYHTRVFIAQFWSPSEKNPFEQSPFEKNSFEKNPFEKALLTKPFWKVLLKKTLLKSFIMHFCRSDLWKKTAPDFLLQHTVQHRYITLTGMLLNKRQKKYN